MTMVPIPRRTGSPGTIHGGIEGENSSERVGAIVDFYGIHPNIHPDLSKLAAPILGIFGEQDDSEPPTAVAQLEAAVRKAGGAIEIHIYPNVTHAFFNDSRPEAYNAETAADAWDRTLGFLQQQLVSV